MIKSPTKQKKEIRLTVGDHFYTLLKQNANIYGVSTNDYIIHLILSDVKTVKYPYISDLAESTVDESYKEISTKKKAGNLKGLTSQEIMAKI